MILTSLSRIGLGIEKKLENAIVRGVENSD